MRLAGVDQQAVVCENTDLELRRRAFFGQAGRVWISPGERRSRGALSSSLPSNRARARAPGSRGTRHWLGFNERVVDNNRWFHPPAGVRSPPMVARDSPISSPASCPVKAGASTPSRSKTTALFNASSLTATDCVRKHTSKGRSRDLRDISAASAEGFSRRASAMMYPVTR